MRKNNLPIGIFDSGVGGLTVAKEIARVLPKESILYLGDTARVPYGTRSKETIKKFALELARFLLKRKVKCLVIACNTISANALDEIRRVSPVPVYDVISPVLPAINGKTVVIATNATIKSGAYPCPGKACPLFVPLVEEGLADSEVALVAAKHYLQNAQVDTLILGCTHFPIMRKTISKITGANIIDPAEQLAKTIEVPTSGGKREITFLVTDSVEKAREVAGYFWPESLKYNWEQVKL